MPLSYFSLVRIASQRSLLGRERGIQVSVELLLRQDRWFFGRTKDLHSSPSSSLAEFHASLRPSTTITARSELDYQRRNIYLLEALSHTFSIPSVSGHAFQICGYHIHCAFGKHKLSLVENKVQLNMAAYGSKAFFTECVLNNLNSNHKNSPVTKNSPCIRFSRMSFENCLQASMQLKNQEQPDGTVTSGYFAYNVAKRLCNSYLQTCVGVRGMHTAPSFSFSGGIASDISFDNSAREEQIMNSSDSFEREIPSGKTLKLVSGSCYLPHPEKEETGGEDAHFICVDEHAIGVADGVGGWADLGVDSGLYSRELMGNSVIAIQDEPKGSIDSARVLEKAHLSTKAQGSSTACIVALTDQGLHAINLGDSGFMVVRDGCTVFRSPVQQHDFNFTFQLESGSDGDLPSSGQVFTIPVAPGDVIIAGTDGLFDNLYNNEITAVVVHALRAGLGCQVTAQKIAALARQRALDKDRQTPFSTAAQDAGFRYYGGKLDDITVVVSYITNSNDK